MIDLGYVLDTSLLAEMGRGDFGLIDLIATLDGRSVRMSVPILALSVAAAHLHKEQRDRLAGALLLDHVELDALSSIDDAARLTLLVERLADAPSERPSELSVAHTAAVARRLGWPVLTADRKPWDAEVRPLLPWDLIVVDLQELDR
ncbi:hypothetical protein [Nonomuraea dietziae]|uniref:PIN domain-containing protein n=1 Tax=Nonomuraea dietziae TaxID=65515 RepID=A0A7W5V7M9_9ACTN|nr:hypothetical protein [Nonomuraea dietziae]MBB3726420.1 hypothetical protein [Nonomuraea dietziae]